MTISGEREISDMSAPQDDVRKLESATEALTQTDWATVLSQDSSHWQFARHAAEGGPRILIANAIGTDPGVANIETALAIALTLRGAKVHILLCDEALPACWVSQIDHVDTAEFVKFGPTKRLCGRCFAGARNVFQSLGLLMHRYSELISDDERRKSHDLAESLSVEEIKDYRLESFSVGEHALSGALRYYALGDLEGEPEGEAILRRYFSAALQTVFALRRLLTTYSFTCVSTLHGIYVPEGLIGEVARAQNVRVVDWTLSYRKKTFIFSHGDTYHRTLLNEATSSWESLNWSPEMEAEILDYLASRRYGTRDWVKFVENPQEDISAIAAKLGVDFSEPCVGLLTNVMWDAQVNYDGNAFANMLEWILETIQYFAKRSDLQLIIRVHPGELLGKPLSRQPIIDEINRAFPTLPKNVFIIPPESTISTYAVMAKCNAVIIYATKTGVELAPMGIPVIVAGEAWIRNKDLTLDANSAQHYFELLDRLPLEARLSEAITRRARKYAYHFFFRRMIPLPFMVPTGAVSVTSPHYVVKVSGIADLLPGRSVGLDVVCDGILTGAEFVYPAERFPVNAVDDPEMSGDARAQWNFRTAEILGEMGELARMRAHVLKTLVDFPWVLEKSWARSEISRTVCHLAAASDKPIATTRDFWAEVRTLTINGNHDLGKELMIRRLSADAWRQLALTLWKICAYRLAGYVALKSIFEDPTQLLEKSRWKRLVKLIVSGRKENLTKTLSAPID